MVTKAGDMIGVECEKCHQEAFRLVERKILVEVTVKCCPTCVRQIDFAAEEQTTKSERRRFFQERSFEWASNLHGKRVLVNSLPRGTDINCNVRGTAYRIKNECGGWGNIKIIIDPREHHRISELSYGGTSRTYPKVDGHLYGLYLDKGEDGSYYVLMSWGSRKEVIEDI